MGVSKNSLKKKNYINFEKKSVCKVIADLREPTFLLYGRPISAFKLHSWFLSWLILEMTASSSPQGLRQRKAADDGLGDSRALRGESVQSEKSRQAHEEVVWGQTPDGEGRR